jgi:hypothetical protein
LLPDCSTLFQAVSNTETRKSIVSGSKADWVKRGIIDMTRLRVVSIMSPKNKSKALLITRETP